jgi:hypothetical protein
MRPSFSISQLRETRFSEYLVRFVFGGAVAVAASTLGELYGPSVGGLFLAFPTLLPASLTLVKLHDGRSAAVQDARGALVGSAGLASFAAVVWSTASWSTPAVTLGLALLAWILVSVTLWWSALGSSS